MNRYPRGGFHKVVEELEKIATKKFDAKFVYNTGIEKIIIDNDQVAKGVRLENGEEKYADIVVCNAGISHCFFLPFHLDVQSLLKFEHKKNSNVRFGVCLQ